MIEKLELSSNQILHDFQNQVYSLYDEWNFEPIYVKPLTNYAAHLEKIDKIEQNESSCCNHNNCQCHQQSITFDTDNRISSTYMNNNQVDPNYVPLDQLPNPEYFQYIDMNDSPSMFMEQMEPLQLNNNNFQINNNYQVNNNNYGPVHHQSYSVQNQRTSPYFM